jgi:hypothetical protein
MQDPDQPCSCRAARVPAPAAHDTDAEHERTDTTAVPAPLGAGRHGLLQLQRHHGNRFVGRVIDRLAAAGLRDEDAIEHSIDQARSGGQRLDAGLRRQMESSFGADFGNVRIHADADADQLSRSLSARAFTTGQDVFFRQGEYAPGSTAGRELLAHELTHVVQQGGAGSVQCRLDVSEPGDPEEVEADTMARAVIEQEQRGQDGDAA